MENWQQIKKLFHEAIDFVPDERAGFLDSQRVDDEARREVENLLKAHDKSEDFIAAPAVFEFGMIAPDFDVKFEETTSRIGEKIGNYEITGELGKGGMGAVYLARRADDEFNLEVALKIVKRGMDTDFIVRRFRSERQILASLNHPNIARLLEGGTTANGLPYLVMEYVDGKDLISYCAEKNLNLEEILLLFREVCAAVEYAHQNLVVHRDLKPSNILVTPKGVPKLLDFGIAKLLSDDSGSTKTAEIARLLTPEYASPEQIRGEKITTASDVYSLGVVLYQLLTAQSPYRAQTKSFDEIIRAVCDTEPIRPSEITARQLIETRTKEDNAKSKMQNPKLLRGDLDNIVIKTLQKEPARRYSSVQEFSEDIRRHLEGLPVKAQADTFSYRTAKFVKRNRVFVFASLFIFLSLVSGITATSWQAHRANVERAKAEQRFADVRALSNSLLLEIHDAIKDLPGSTPARQLMVKKALESLDKLAQDSANNTVLQRDLAIAYERVGDVQGNPNVSNLGDTTGAIESYAKASDIRENLLSDVSSEEREKYNTAMLNGKICQVNAYQINMNAAEIHCRKALDLLEGAVEDDPDSIDFRNALADSYSQTGELLKNEGDNENALENLKKSIAISEAVLTDDGFNSEALINTRLAYSRAGEAFENEKKPREALDAYLKALATAEKASNASPQNVRFKLILAIADGKVGFAQAVLGNYKEALEYSSNGRKLLADIVGNDPQNTYADRQLACAFKNVGFTFLQSGGNLTAALANFQQALAIKEKLHEKDESDVFLLGDMGETTAYIGLNYERIAAAEVSEKAKQAALNNAKNWYSRSLEIWLTLRESGKLPQYFSRKPDELNEAIAKIVRRGDKPIEYKN